MTGTRITAASYNTIQAIVSTVLGTPTATIGYGQLVTSTSVVVGQPITSLNWVQLQADINQCRMHQYGIQFAASLLPNVSVNNSILLDTTTKYASCSNNITIDALLAHIANMTLTSSGSTITRTTSWGRGGTAPSDSITGEMQITWSSETEKNKFLNTGGIVQWKLSHSSVSTNQDSNWNTFLNVPVCNIHRGITTSTDESVLVSVDSLSSAYQTVLSRSSSGLYSSNTYSIALKQIANGYQIKIVLSDGYTNATVDLVAPGTNVVFSHLKSTAIMSNITSPMYTTVTNF